MVQFFSDDQDVERVLRKMCQQLKDHGGLVRHGLVIGSRKGDLVVRTPESIPDGAPILIVPKDCLLPVDKFKIGLKGDDMVIEGRDADLTTAQIELMDSMIELYNLTGKIAMQRKTSTLSMYYKDKDLIELVLGARSKKSLAFVGDILKTDPEIFIQENFIKSRVLGFRENAQDQADDETKKTKVLMPVIDFLNNHPAATGYYTNFGDSNLVMPEGGRFGQDGVAVRKSCPVAGSDECYVFYGPYDALDMLINYNYVETNASFVRSVPLDVKITGVGTLNIRSVTAWPQHKKLADQLKDLAFYIPGMQINAEKKQAMLNFLYISQKNAPRAMRRVLALALNRMSGNAMTEAELLDAVRFAEKRVIDENLKHYDRLLAYLAACKPEKADKLIMENIKGMAETQLEKIRNYPFYDEARDGMEKGAKRAAV